MAMRWDEAGQDWLPEASARQPDATRDDTPTLWDTATMLGGLLAPNRPGLPRPPRLPRPPLLATLSTAVVAVLIAGGVWVVSGDDTGTSGLPPSPATTGGGAPSDRATDPDPPVHGPTRSAEDPPTTSPPTASSPTAPSLPTLRPDDFRTVSEDGFRLAVPKGWERSGRQGTFFYKAPDERSLIQVIHWRDTEETPYEQLSEMRAEVQQREGEDLTAEPVERVGDSTPAAELRYSYRNADLGPRLVLARAFRAEADLFAVLVATPQQRPGQAATLFATVLDSFCTTSAGCLTPD